MKRTSPDVERNILTLILLGHPYADIAERTGVAVSTIKKIKARNKQGYSAGVIELEHSYIDEARAIQQRAHRRLKAIMDEADLGVRQLSVGELLRIAKYSEKVISREQRETPRSSVFDQQEELDRLLELLKKNKRTNTAAPTPIRPM